MFSDYDSISEACRPYVAVAVERSLVSGYPDGTFRAQQTITRAEAATLLWRAFQYGNDNKVVEGGENTKTDTPTPTETEPEKEQTDEPTPTPTPSPTPTPAQPLTVDTIVSTSTAGMYILDNQDNIYYLDRTAGKIIKVNVASKSKEEILTLSDLNYEDDEMALSGFYVLNIIWDDVENQLLIQGAYEQINSSKDIKRHYLLALKNGIITDTGVDFYFRFDYEIFGIEFAQFSLIEAVYSAGNYQYGLPTGGGHHGDWGLHFYVEKTANTLYYIDTSGIFYEYDFANSKKIFDTFQRRWTLNSLKNGIVYSNHADGSNYADVYNVLTLYNYKGKELASFSSSDIQVKDMKQFQLGNVQMMCITQGGDIVYYDSSVGAFRLITIEV
jgi:hypothetical protein